VSGSQLAHYFADKGALVRAVIARQIGVGAGLPPPTAARGLDSFDDFERWIDLNLRYLRRIGYVGTPTYHALAAQLAKSDDGTREALGAGYREWMTLLSQAIQRMKTTAFWSRMPTRSGWRRSLSALTRAVAPWPSPIGRSGRTPTRSASRQLPADVRDRYDQRAPRPPRRSAGPGARPGSQLTRLRQRWPKGVEVSEDSRFTRKGLATRARIVAAAKRLMFERGIANTSIDQVRPPQG